MHEGDALRLRGVSKSYGGVPALRNVDFSIEPGESVGYLGPNGAGKTTTLKLFSGLTRADSGEVLVAGFDLNASPRKALASIGVLVETPGILPYMKGRDLLRHVAEVKGVAREEFTGSIDRASAELGVTESMDKTMGSLSTGVLRRVLLAAALVGDPKILLLDEPTLGLDPAARADLRVTLKRLREAGRTIFLTTHIIEDVEEVCSRVLFLRSGQIVGDEEVSMAPSEVEGWRTVIVTLLEDARIKRVVDLVGNRGEVELRSPKELVIRFRGGDIEQSEIVGILATGGVRVLHVGSQRPDLEARYIELVGREQAK